MILFIIGCILAGIVVISIPVFCVVLLKMEKKITTLGWKFYFVMFTLLVIGLVAAGLIFGGFALMQQ